MKYGFTDLDPLRVAFGPLQGKKSDRLRNKGSDVSLWLFFYTNEAKNMLYG